MKTASVTYLGDLRTEAVHDRSGSRMITDAPVDNHGKGEAFSPTDLVGVALLTCMITTMGLAAQGREWNLGPVEGDVEKIMASGPRRISKLISHIRFLDCPLDEEQRKVMEAIGHNCPVAKGLHPDIVLETQFEYL